MCTKNKREKVKSENSEKPKPIEQTSWWKWQILQIHNSKRTKEKYENNHKSYEKYMESNIEKRKGKSDQPGKGLKEKGK